MPALPGEDARTKAAVTAIIEHIGAYGLSCHLTGELAPTTEFMAAFAELGEAHRSALAQREVETVERCRKAVCHGCAEGWPYEMHETTAGDGVPAFKTEHNPEGRQSGWLPCTAVGIRALAGDGWQDDKTPVK